MRKFHFYLFLLIGILFVGCTTKSFAPPVSALIVIKTPVLRYADQGFVYQGSKDVRLQIYGAGGAIFDLHVGKRVCTDKGCMSEEAFEKKFMGVVYPKGTLAAIFSHRPIFGGLNLQKKKERFIQRIEEDRFDIIYAFDAKHVRFVDRKNDIFIKITKE